MRAGRLRISSRSAIASSSSSISSVRFKIYSRFRWRSLISATYSACTSSMPKPIIRLGTTSVSSAVLRTISMALSMSSRIAFRPLQQVQALFLALQIVVGAAAHALGAEGDPLAQNARARPAPCGWPAISTLKLQAKLSSSGVALNRRCHQLVRVLAALEVNGQL